MPDRHLIMALIQQVIVVDQDVHGQLPRGVMSCCRSLVAIVVFTEAWPGEGQLALDIAGYRGIPLGVAAGVTSWLERRLRLLGVPHGLVRGGMACYGRPQLQSTHHACRRLRLRLFCFDEDQQGCGL